jgi:hypothetical protein
MNSLTVLLYLFGHAGSIRRVASSPMAVPVGILLVFSAAVARNYDQVWYGESRWWLFGPLIFSFFSGAWLLLWVCRAWAPKPLAPRDAEGAYPDGFGGIAISFFGLFWMTAPIAWIYAIPVERWYEPVEAARWNVRLLLIVALWRVLLMGRVVSVIWEVPFLRGLSRVLLPAALETLLIGFFASLGRAVMAGMGGLRNSPAEDVLLQALGTTMAAAFFIAIIGGAVEFSLRRFKMRTIPWQPETGFPRWRAPWLLLLAIASVGWWMSIKPQQEQFLTHQAKTLAQRKDWAGLVAFLSKHRQEEFAPSIPLPPTAYEYWHVGELPFVIDKLTPETPIWVRQLYAGYLDFFLEQERAAYLLRADDGFAKVLLAAETIPEVRRVVKRRAEVIEKHSGEWKDGTWERSQLQKKLDQILVLPD